MSDLPARLVQAAFEKTPADFSEAEALEFSREAVVAVLRELAVVFEKAEHDFTGWPDSADLHILADEIEGAS